MSEPPLGNQGALTGLQATFARTVRPIGLGLAAFYAFLAVFWLLQLRPEYGLLGMAWPTVATLFLLLAFLSRRLVERPGWGTAVGSAMALLVVSASSLLLWEAGHAALSIGLYITVLGFSLLLVSRGSLLLTLGTSLAGWSLAAWRWGGPDWTTRGIALLACCIAAILVQDMRLRLFRRLEAAQRRELAARTELMRAENRRAEAEAKTTFMRLAAHEFSTPMTSIVIQTRALARSKGLGDAQQKAVGILERNVARLHALMRDLTLITQSGQGTLPLLTAKVALETLVAEALREAGPTAAAANVMLSAHTEPGLAVQGDAEKLGIALRKVLENAIRFSPPGGRITVSTRASAGQVQVEVADQGPGIPYDRIEQLFEAFNVGQDLMHRSGGAGLGLTVARAIVAAHGGQLGHRANPGGGSIFTMEFPAA